MKSLPRLLRNNLAICYWVEIDLGKAVQWYQKSAEIGNSGVQFILASCY